MRKKLSKRICRWLAVAGIFFAIGCLCACGPSYDEEQSPKLIQVETWGENDGTEEGQYLCAELTFDREIAISDKLGSQLRITVGGNRIREERMEISSECEKLLIKMKEEFATTGELHITAENSKNGITAITDPAKKYALGKIDVTEIIPSGVTLEEKTMENGAVGYQITSLWTHRGILWLQVFCDGQVQMPVSAAASETTGTGAVAVHGHYFRTDTEEDIAGNIAEVLNTYFGNILRAEANQEKGWITIFPVSEGTSKIEIKEYLGEEK